MAQYGKRLRKACESIESSCDYAVSDAIGLVKKHATAKFDETIEIAINCDIDPKKTDQNVRGVVVLPEGTGKTVRVAVFARDALAKKAKDAGADIVGSDDLVEKVIKGEIDFDSCIATPDMMPLLGRIGKILGPRGLMPNPKLGSVTNDVEAAVKAVKGGQVSFRSDKGGVVHAIIGKASFKVEALKTNFDALVSALEQVKPSVIKKELIKSASMSSTMGISVKLRIEHE